MYNPGTLSALILVTVTGAARAQGELPAGEPAPAPVARSLAAPAADPAAKPDERLQLGVALLPMVFGRITGGQEVLFPSTDAAVAYGIGVSFSYRIISGLSVGIAPQALFNIKAQDDPNSSATEYDILARVAYTYAMLPRLSVYAEALPGYSVISLPTHATNIEGATVDNPKGLVLAFGAGAALAIADKFFVNLGLGYQLGYQQGSVGGADFDFKTRFFRIALGGGVKL